MLFHWLEDSRLRMPKSTAKLQSTENPCDGSHLTCLCEGLYMHAACKHNKQLKNNLALPSQPEHIPGGRVIWQYHVSRTTAEFGIVRWPHPHHCTVFCMWTIVDAWEGWYTVYASWASVEAVHSVLFLQFHVLHFMFYDCPATWNYWYIFMIMPVCQCCQYPVYMDREHQHIRSSTFYQSPLSFVVSLVLRLFLIYLPLSYILFSALPLLCWAGKCLFAQPLGR